MKVIKPGRPADRWTREFECRGDVEDWGCGAILLIEKGDIWIDGWDSLYDYYITPTTFMWRCPECGKEHTEDIRLIPSHIREDLPREEPPVMNRVEVPYDELRSQRKEDDR